MNVQSRFKCLNDLNIDIYSYFLNQQPRDGLHCLLQRRTQRYSGKHFDIIKKKIEIILSKIQASHSTAQYFKLAGGLAERVAAVLVIVIAVYRIITIIIIFIIIIVIAITIDPMIR